jgi:hypothetical protein
LTTALKTEIELDSFDKNPQRKDRTNSGGGLIGLLDI